MEDEEGHRLRQLGARIEAAQRANAPVPKRGEAKYSGMELAWRMVIDLVAGVGVGCGIGYGIDSLAGTMPVFILVFTLLGFAAGVRVMMRSARDYQDRLTAPAAPGKEDGPAR